MLSEISKESPEEMLERLSLMASGNPRWDLSRNDREALTWILAEAGQLRERGHDLCQVVREEPSDYHAKPGTQAFTVNLATKLSALEEALAGGSDGK